MMIPQLADQCDRRMPVILLRIFVQMASDILQSVWMCHLALASWMREFFKLLTKWLIGGSLLGTTSTIY